MPNGRPQMPVPSGELRPQELLALIQQWALDEGLQFRAMPHATEFAKVEIHSGDGGWTFASIPNAHRGRRLRRDQVHYVVQQLNARWRQ